MIFKKTFILSGAAALLAVWTVVAAKTHGSMPLLEEKEQNNIRYMSGGVGIDERDDMRARSGRYNLKLVFAEASGLYLAGVKVEIYGTDGKRLVSAVADGPWLMVRLPAGSYKIAAVHDGHRKIRGITVGDRLEKVMFHWKR